MSSAEYWQIGLAAVNALALPAALVSVARWLMKVELRLARLEWQAGAKTEVSP